MGNNPHIIDFQELKKRKTSEKEREKKELTEPNLYDEDWIESEITQLRSEFGLNKEEKKK